MMSNEATPKFQFPHVYIVEASAGSGKTYCLAKRYVQLLLGPNIPFQDAPLKNILAITFTNKAMVEMKERILEFLKKIALDQFSSSAEQNELLLPLGMDAACARLKAEAMLDELIKNYNFFQVQTIDSFINAILSGCAFKLDLSASFKIKTDYRDALAYSLDRLVDRAATEAEPRALFHRFLMQYLHLENRSGWFPKREILKKLQQLFFINNKHLGAFLVPAISFKELSRQKAAVLKKMRRLKEMLPPETRADFKKTLLSFCLSPHDSFDLQNVSKFFARPDFPITKQGHLSAAVVKLWASLRRDLRVLAEAESEFVFGAYVEMLREVAKDLRLLASREDVLFLEELNKQARSLFEEKALTVPELYYRLATRLKHFLIDEFQDTSRLQWENIFMMVEEALATGGSLFYVGDKKQAIYRFRGGEVLLFDAVRARFKGHRIMTEHLVTNYRSEKAIVDFVNAVFSVENLRLFLEGQSESGKKRVLGSAEIRGILEVFQGSQQTTLPGKKAGYVQVRHLDSKNKEERNQLTQRNVLALVEELTQRGFAYQDLALLTRKNDDVELLTEWFLGQGIPVESEKTLNIRHNASIKELVSFLKFLNSPIDNVSFVSFLCSPMFVRATGLEMAAMHGFVFALRQKKTQETPVYLYREFRRQYPPIWERYCEEFFQNVGFVPCYELTVSILEKFRCLEHAADHQGFFMHFLELIKCQEEEHVGLAAFLEYFDQAPDEDLYLKVAQTNALKILTVHKAKGLGFPVVILPFLEFNVKVEPDVCLVEDQGLRLKRIHEAARLFSPQLEEEYRGEYTKAFADELNSIYVAMTRAKEELYIFVPERAEKGTNKVKLLLPQALATVGQPARRSRADRGRRPDGVEIPVSRYRDWVQFLNDEFTDAQAIEHREKILKGDVLHNILALLGNCQGKDTEEMLSDAFLKTKLKFPHADDFGTYEVLVRRLLSWDSVRPFLFVKKGDVYQEKEIVGFDGHARRLDRLIVTPEAVVVIDFKSGREERPQDEEQVREYIELLKTVYSGRNIKGVLIYLDDFIVKEVYG
ncbi:MAG: UvrD-helicase domain-containing protein [Candidatus Omnitrophota bacterium]